jgi:tRNA1(Val) A37 N6-methylase TrmN6
MPKLIKKSTDISIEKKIAKEEKSYIQNFIETWSFKIKSGINEKSESQTFLNELFLCLGIDRKQVALFEKSIPNGFIDLYIPGAIIIEMKSPGLNLSLAYEQATIYNNTLASEDKVRKILCCNFNTFNLYDVIEERFVQFNLVDLEKYLFHFFYLIEKYNQSLLKAKKEEGREYDLNPYIITVLSNFCNILRNQKDLNGDLLYKEEHVTKFMIRIINCLFFDSYGFFDGNKNHADRFFHSLIKKTEPSDYSTGDMLQKVFEILNTQPSKRSTKLSDKLSKIPYVENIFSEKLPIIEFDENMREILFDLTHFNWRQINPLVFGSIFQHCLTQDKRHELGAHFTSRENILKAINPLFLNDLIKEFNLSSSNIIELKKLHKKIGNIRILDPACGSGNFLSILYSELKLLENKICSITEDESNKVTIDHFYGIEIEPFAAEIARLAMRISAMKMENTYSNRSAIIVNDNSLIRDWNTVVPKEELSYIIGNPPFISNNKRTENQSKEMKDVFKENSSCFDYVTAWFKKAADYIKGTKIEVVFIATSAISSPSTSNKLWKALKANINFAYSSFKWNNYGDNDALVNVVIVGFADFNREQKFLNDKPVKNIYPTLENVEEFKELKDLKNPISLKKCYSAGTTKTNPVAIEYNDLCLKRNYDIKNKRIKNIYFEKELCYQSMVVKEASYFDYGILSSALFCTWTKRFKNTESGGGLIHLSLRVYNCFPLPSLTQEQEDHITELGVKVFLNKTEENYEELDKAVDSLYNLTNPTDEERIKVLYDLYKEKINAFA